MGGTTPTMGTAPTTGTAFTLDSALNSEKRRRLLMALLLVLLFRMQIRRRRALLEYFQALPRTVTVDTVHIRQAWSLTCGNTEYREYLRFITSEIAELIIQFDLNEFAITMKWVGISYNCGVGTLHGFIDSHRPLG